MTQAWNLSQLANKVNTSGQLDVSTGASGALPIANGGTNNGSLAVTAGGVAYFDGSKIVNNGAGTAGQVLLSNGASAPTWGTYAAYAGTSMVVFTASTTWTPPSGITQAIITVRGGGGGGGGTTGFAGQFGGAGGSGGIAQTFVTGLSGSYTITIGNGGTGGGVNTTGAAGGTSSFGSIASATGGGGGVGGSAGATGAAGTGTVSGGTALRSGSSAYIAINVIPTGTLGTPASTTPITYSTTGVYGAGAGGSGSSASPFTGGGGISGVVVIIY